MLTCIICGANDEHSEIEEERVFTVLDGKGLAVVFDVAGCTTCAQGPDFGAAMKRAFESLRLAAHRPVKCIEGTEFSYQES